MLIKVKFFFRITSKVILSIFRIKTEEREEIETILFLFFRDKLVNLQPSTGYRFDGNGYTIVRSRPYRMRERSDVQLKFKTTVRDGLLFLAGKGQTFLSVELQDGNVVYQVWHLI